MPRGPRIDAPGAVHHVMVRGIERRSIFADDADRDDLAARLSRVLRESGATCFAWAFMPNHVHLVVRTGSESVSRLMARVGTGYARHFNERHDRGGHLFQNRFRSRVVADDADLLCLIRYVHLNPVVAGIVANLDDLAEYPWTGHAGLVGRIEPQLFHATGETLALFGSTPRDARAQLRCAMELGLRDPDFDPWEAEAIGGDASLLGSSTDAANDRVSELADVAREVCRRLQVDPVALRSGVRVRTVSRARAAVASRAVAQLGIPLAEVARWLGVSPSALSHALSRAAR